MNQKFLVVWVFLDKYIEFPLFSLEEAMNTSKREIQPSADWQFQDYEIFHGLREHHVWMVGGWGNSFELTSAVSDQSTFCSFSLELRGPQVFHGANTELDANLYKHLF